MNPNLLTQRAFFENVGVKLGRAVREAPEPFCASHDAEFKAHRFKQCQLGACDAALHSHTGCLPTVYQTGLTALFNSSLSFWPSAFAAVKSTNIF